MKLLDGFGHPAGDTVVALRGTGFIDEDAPYETAAAFLSAEADQEGLPTIRYWRDDFFRWCRSHYEVVPIETIRSTLYDWLSRQVSKSKNRPVKPTKATVDKVVDALKARACANIASAPAWLEESESAPPAEEIVACANGLLRIPTRELLPHTPRFFSLNALAFDYAPNAAVPLAWHTFLRSVWGDDLESIETLQEIFGLLLTPETKYQKMFLFVGPRRAGKGTIGRTLSALVGKDNITAPTLPSLAGPFGLQPLIGKSLALISDARLGGRADTSAVAENLLRISGEDCVSVHRKYKSAWEGRLPIRFLMLSNELPAVSDEASALPGRFIVLRLTRSFFGEEDLGLEQRLLTELPGILLWALEGLERLRRRGYFRQPASAVQMIRELEHLSSPIKAFATECCVIHAGASIACSSLYASWQVWSNTNGHKAGSLQLFGRNLRTAFPAIRVTRRRVGEGRERFYEGIKLREKGDPDADEQ